MPGIDPSDTNRERRLPLDGATNFRDLGGYVGADGRRLRWGQVFRADHLGDLSQRDLEAVSALGLRTVCDLRAEVERAQRPDRELPAPAPRAHAIGFMPQGGAALIAGARSLSVAAVEREVTAIYRDFVHQRRAHYARLFELMLEADAFPFLFHCTSGRDRTGFAAVLLLSALGVPRESVEADYVLSDHYRRDLRFQIGEGIAPEVMHAITRSHPAYFAALFEEMDRGWGGVGPYLRRALNVSDAAQRQLRERLLEPAPSD